MAKANGKIACRTIKTTPCCLYKCGGYIDLGGVIRALRETGPVAETGAHNVRDENHIVMCETRTAHTLVLEHIQYLIFFSFLIFLFGK